MGKLVIIKGIDFSNVAVGKVEPIEGMVAINVVASPSGGGVVSGSGFYSVGSRVQITAVASSGYAFSQWSDGDTNASRTITVGSTAETYTAEFSIQSVSDEGYLSANLTSDGTLSKETFACMTSTLRRPVLGGATITFNIPSTLAHDVSNYIKIGEYTSEGVWIRRQYASYDSGLVQFTLSSNAASIIVCIQSNLTGVGETLKTIFSNTTLSGTKNDSVYGTFDPSKYNEMA